MATNRQRPPSIIRQQRKVALQRDPNSMVASAAVMSGRAGTVTSGVKATSADWQAKAWEMYDSVGELRFGTSWIANALSRVNLIAAVPPRSQGDEPSVIDLDGEEQVTAGMKRAVELVGEIAGGPAGQGVMLAALARLLTIPGVSYIYAKADLITDSFSTWRTLSNDEIRSAQGGQLEVANALTGTWEPIGESDLIVKVWRQHPRRAWEADSPVRALLSVLNEIMLVTSRIAADSKSRLAGNGLLVMPDEAEFPAGQGFETSDDSEDEFVETFMQVTQIPIQDQDSPAAMTPLIVRVPGDVADKVRHVTFYSQLSEAADTIRQAAIKRLALGLDMPPEVLLGLGDSNHWSAWQIEEEAITLQVEPLAEIICHALTIGFLKPALEAEGLGDIDALVWYDTTDLTTRPDRSGVAAEAHARFKLSDGAYLRELGLDETDMPGEDEFRRRYLLDLARTQPVLAPVILAALGILDQVLADAAAAAVVEADEPGAGTPPAPVAPDAPADGPPERQDAPPEAASTVALLAAADGLVHRALERAGSRLRAAAGRGREGGAASIPCDDLTTLHCAIDATCHAPLESLLAGAWDRVPVLAARHVVDPDSLTACLDGYVRGLLAAGHAHDIDRLAAALGVRSYGLAHASV